MGLGVGTGHVDLWGGVLDRRAAFGVDAMTRVHSNVGLFARGWVERELSAGSRWNAGAVGGVRVQWP